MVVDKVAHRIEYGLFQTGFVGTAQGGGNQVDIAFGGHAAFFQPGERKRHAFAGAEIAVAVGTDMAFGGKHRHGFLGVFQ